MHSLSASQIPCRCLHSNLSPNCFICKMLSSVPMCNRASNIGRWRAINREERSIVPSCRIVEGGSLFLSLALISLSKIPNERDRSEPGSFINLSKKISAVVRSPNRAATFSACNCNLRFARQRAKFRFPMIALNSRPVSVTNMITATGKL